MEMERRGVMAEQAEEEQQARWPSAGHRALTSHSAHIDGHGASSSELSSFSSESAPLVVSFTAGEGRSLS